MMTNSLVRSGLSLNLVHNGHMRGHPKRIQVGEKSHVFLYLFFHRLNVVIMTLDLTLSE
jgi:hypothetical protein